MWRTKNPIEVSVGIINNKCLCYFSYKFQPHVVCLPKNDPEVLSCAAEL